MDIKKSCKLFYCSKSNLKHVNRRNSECVQSCYSITFSYHISQCSIRSICIHALVIIQTSRTLEYSLLIFVHSMTELIVFRAAKIRARSITEASKTIGPYTAVFKGRFLAWRNFYIKNSRRFFPMSLSLSYRYLLSDQTRLKFRKRRTISAWIDEWWLKIN